jgi:hypothetical protein
MDALFTLAQATPPPPTPRKQHTEAQFIVPDWGYKVDFHILIMALFHSIFHALFTAFSALFHSILPARDYEFGLSTAPNVVFKE